MKQLSNIFNSLFFQGIPSLGTHALQVGYICGEISLIICGFQGHQHGNLLIIIVRLPDFAAVWLDRTGSLPAFSVRGRPPLPEPDLQNYRCQAFG